MAITDACRSLVRQRYLHLYNARPLGGDILVRRVCDSNGSRSPVIPRGSHIVVNHGITVLVIDNGEVVALYDRPGKNLVDFSEEPSLFSNDGASHLLDTLISRIQLNGQPANVQYVVSVNTRQICMNPLRFSVPLPVMVGNGFSAFARIHLTGTFKLRITDPEAFFNAIAFSEEDDIFETELLQQSLEEQIRSELASCLDTLSEEAASLPGLLYRINQLGTRLADRCSCLAFEVSDVCFSSVEIDPEDQLLFRRLQQLALYNGPHREAIDCYDRNRALMAFSLRSGTPGEVYGLGMYNEILNQDRSYQKHIDL